jgi:hypothetical protein
VTDAAQLISVNHSVDPNEPKWTGAHHDRYMAIAKEGCVVDDGCLLDKHLVLVAVKARHRWMALFPPQIGHAAAPIGTSSMRPTTQTIGGNKVLWLVCLTCSVHSTSIL